MEQEPKTLKDAILFFADPKNCREYLVARRWPNGVECPRCGSKNVKFSEKFNRWQCGSHHERRQFTLKTGTIFEESPIELDKWLATMWQVVNCKNGVSSYEIGRAVGVTQKTAWFMLSRLREIMQDPDTGGKLSGEVEVDETYIGGKARNMHQDRKERMMQGHKAGPVLGAKSIVIGMLEREGRVRASVVPDRKKATVQEIVRQTVEAGSQIMSDEHGNNWKMDEYEHAIVNHLETYVSGNVHTNTLENFWSLLKRQLHGTYISVEPFHLFRYVDEQAFRYNHRKNMNDGDRFSLAVSQIVGKRLTWNRLTGKESEPRQTAE
jgi:transposase-like protein